MYGCRTNFVTLLGGEGIHRLELLFITHGDMDLPAVLQLLSAVYPGAAIAPVMFEGTGADLVRQELNLESPLYRY